MSKFGGRSKMEVKKAYVKEMNDLHKKFSEQTIADSYKLVQDGNQPLGELEEVKFISIFKDITSTFVFGLSQSLSLYSVRNTLCLSRSSHKLPFFSRSLSRSLLSLKHAIPISLL